LQKAWRQKATEEVMGYGDWIMASVDVRKANQATGKKVKLGDGRSMFFDEQVFSNNPRMAKADEKDFVWVPNHPRKRPYILSTDQDSKRIIFNDDFKPTPGEIWFSDEEEEWADKNSPKGDFIVIEPAVKDTYAHTINKSWPYWGMVMKMDMPFVRLGNKEATIRTKTFRQAMLILSRATMFVGTDGGLHHASAALNVPAVVVWTGFTSPKHLGYDSHVNIHDGGDPCGYFGGACPHCRKVAKSISPEVVIKSIGDEFEKHSRNLAT